MRKLLCTLLSLLLFITNVQGQQTTHLEGRVFLNDTLPAAYATLYLPQHGMGTVTDEQGRYQLDNIPVGPSIVLEYAFLGYKTEQIKVNLSQPNHRYAHDHHMQEQAILLDEVYLTPNGEDPCIYIIRKVHEQAQKNRKRLKSYTAVCDGSFHVQDLDVLVEILPGFAKTMLHGMLRPLGLNALFNYVTGSDKVDATYRYTQTWNQGKVKNSDINILSSNPTMPDKVKQQLKKFQVESFFAMFYGDDKKFDAKKVTKKGWKLKGVIEENGMTIDVLTRSEGKSIKYETSIYVIEDLWTVLRYENHTSEGGLYRVECRDIGDGIYMPVLYATNPMPLNIDKMIEDMKKENDEAKEKGDGSRIERNMVKRYEKIISDRSSVNINFITPYTIRYEGVSIDK